MKRLASITTIALLLQSTILAGVVYEIETKDHEQSPPKAQTIQISAQGKSLKMGIPAGGSRASGEMIFRGDRREMVIVDHDRKAYFLMDEASMRQMAGQINQAMRQMEEALKNVPEDRRAMIEKMMKDRMPQAKTPSRPKTTLRKTGDRATKNGYPCVKYEVLSEGRVKRELWVTNWSNVDGGREAAQAFEEMAGFFTEMMDAMGGAGGPFSGGLDDNPFEHMKDMDGFPVVTKEFSDDGSLEGESSLRSARRQTLDPADFEPPAGYKRQQMPGR